MTLFGLLVAVVFFLAGFLIGQRNQKLPETPNITMKWKIGPVEFRKGVK